MKNKNFVPVFFVRSLLLPLILTGLSLFSCSTNSGNLNGTVYDQNGAVAANVLLKLFVADDEGDELADIATAISDSNGRFTFKDAQTPGSTMLAKVILPTGEMRGFAVGNGSQVIVHPITEALVQAVLNMTTPSGGLTLQDFDSADLRTLTKIAVETDSSSITLSDSSAVFALLLGQHGRAIAAASGAGFIASDSASFEPTNSLSSGLLFTDPSGTCLLAQFYLLGGKNYSFDVTPEGMVCDGFSDFVSDTFDNAFLASISNDTFTSNNDSAFPQQTEPVTQDTTTVVLGPESTTNNVSLTRKIYVDPAGDVVRFLEILKNNDSNTHTVDLDITGNLGSDDATQVVVRGESDNPILIPTDRFAATISALVSTVSSVGFVWQDNNGIDLTLLDIGSGGAVDQFRYAWRDISLAGNETKTFLHYAFIDPSHDPETLRARAKAIANAPDMSNMFGSELMGLQNFAAQSGNVVGASGSVTAGATVTIKNSRTGIAVTTQARNDWGFAGFIDAIAGDTITITATDGLSTTVTVP